MSSIFSEKDSNVKVLIPRFQGGLSLYYNNKSHQIGFLGSEIYAAYPELCHEPHHSDTPPPHPADTEDPLSIEDSSKRKIYLVLKHAKWISPVLLKGAC